MSAQHRILGIDHGDVRVGLALSDPMGLFAAPFQVLVQRSRTQTLDKIRRLIEEQDVRKVIVGLPTTSDGELGDQARKVIEWSRALESTISVPVFLWDESYSTTAARAMEAGRHRKGRPPTDHIAAAVLLQDYLDVQRTKHEPGQTLESFNES